MAKRYNFKNIRILLTKGFTAKELRRFCFETYDFRPVYEQLAQNMGPDEIIQKMIVHADSRLKFDILLKWAEEEIPERYKEHLPYYDYDPVRILLVDDNPDWRNQLSGLLQDKGYEVVTAASKEEALQCIRKYENFNLAIIDMRLDEADEENREGIDLGYWLRTNRYNLPIIIISAYNMDAEVVKDMALRPFQFSPVEKGNIGSGGIKDLLHQIKLVLSA